MEVKVKLIEDGIMPSRAHDTDAGLDCYARTKTIDSNGKMCFKLGFAIEIPNGYVGLIFPRSSVSKYDLSMCNCVGVIDSGYRGEVSAKFNMINGLCLNSYKIGERVCQLIIMPYPKVELIQVDSLSETERGEGGYGSSGK